MTPPPNPLPEAERGRKLTPPPNPLPEAERGRKPTPPPTPLPEAERGRKLTPPPQPPSPKRRGGRKLTPPPTPPSPKRRGGERAFWLPSPLRGGAGGGVLSNPSESSGVCRYGRSVGPRSSPLPVAAGGPRLADAPGDAGRACPHADAARRVGQGVARSGLVGLSRSVRGRSRRYSALPDSARAGRCPAGAGAGVHPLWSGG